MTCSSKLEFAAHQRDVGRYGKRDEPIRPQFPRSRGGRAYDIAEIDPVAFEIERAAFEARHVEEICDEMGKPDRFFLDGREEIVARLLRHPARRGSAGW